MQSGIKKLVTAIANRLFMKREVSDRHPNRTMTGREMQIFFESLEMVRNTSDLATVTEAFELMRTILQSNHFLCPPVRRDDMMDGFSEAYGKYQRLCIADIQAKETAFQEVEKATRLNLFATIAPLIAAQPGILQKTLCQQVKDQSAHELRYALYTAEKCGLVHRQKSGNSYRLTLAPNN